MMGFYRRRFLYMGHLVVNFFRGWKCRCIQSRIDGSIPLGLLKNIVRYVRIVDQGRRGWNLRSYENIIWDVGKISMFKNFRYFGFAKLT